MTSEIREHSETQTALREEESNQTSSYRQSLKYFVLFNSYIKFDPKLIGSSVFCFYQVLPGCDCCEVNGELVKDKHTWTVNGKTYGKDIILTRIAISRSPHADCGLRVAFKCLNQCQWLPGWRLLNV